MYLVNNVNAMEQPHITSGIHKELGGWVHLNKPIARSTILCITRGEDVNWSHRSVIGRDGKDVMKK